MGSLTNNCQPTNWYEKGKGQVDLREERADDVQRGFQDGRRHEGDVETWYCSKGEWWPWPAWRPTWKAAWRLLLIKGVESGGEAEVRGCRHLSSNKIGSDYQVKDCCPLGQWKIRPSWPLSLWWRSAKRYRPCPQSATIRFHWWSGGQAGNRNIPERSSRRPWEIDSVRDKEAAQTN